MPNILICASTFPRYRSDTTVDFVWQQARYFKKHYPDLNIHILCPHAPGAKKFEVWDDISIHRYRYCLPESMQTLVYPAIWPNIKESKGRILQVPLLLMALFFAAHRVCKRHKIDLIYSHWFMPQGMVCSVVSRLCKIPHVLTSHAADIIVMRKIPLIGEWVVRKTLPTFNRISFAGSRGLSQAKSFFDDAESSKVADKFAVLPMGVDFTLPKEFSLSNSPKQELKLVFVGRLAEKKGVSYLLKAVQQAISEGSSVTLDVLGDGPLLEQLQNETKSLEIENHVIYHGFITGDDKYKAILSCDLFLVPSIVTADGDAEGLPVSLLEAMAAGALCCATDESGATDIIESEDTAFLIKAKSVSELKQVIQRVEKMSPSDRERMKENAKLLGESFKWDQMIHKHYDYLLKPAIKETLLHES